MFRRFIVVVSVARLAVYTSPLGLILAAANAGTASGHLLGLTAALTIGSGIGLWPAGRLLDRVGPWRGLRASMLVGGCSLLLLGAGIGWSWRPGVLVGVATLSGALWSPVIAAPRAMLPDVTPAGSRTRASGLEAATVEGALIVAPLVGMRLAAVGADVAVAGPGLVLAITALSLGGPPVVQRAVAPRDDPRGAPLFGFAMLAVLLGVSGGWLEPALAVVPDRLPASLGGNALLLTAVAVGSATGGLLAASTGRPSRPIDAVWLLTAHAVALAGASAVTGHARLALLFAAGLPVAPLMSLGALRIDRRSPADRSGATYGALTTALILGTGVGQASAAWLLGWVPAPTVVLLTAVPPGVGAASVWFVVRPCRRP